MKNLYCVMGKSGVGKDTIVNRLCDEYSYKRVISYTSRPRRPDPKDELSHIFVTEEDYCKAKADGVVVADTYFDGNYYWVTSEQIDESDLYIIDWDGYKVLKSLYKNRPIKLIVINADKDIRIDRMRQRGDTKADIEKRVTHDDVVFEDIVKHKNLIDLIVSNNHNGNLKGLCEQIHLSIRDMENKDIG